MRVKKLFLLLSLFLLFLGLIPAVAWSVVEITTTHETKNGNGDRILEINGTEIHLGTNPTVTLSGATLTVDTLETGGNKATVLLPDSQQEGTYTLSVSNANGSSAFDVKINKPILPEGADWELIDFPVDWGKRRFFGSVVYDNKMWVMGGHVAPFVKGNDVWNSSDGETWSLVNTSASWVGRERPQVVNFNGEMWLLGGKTSSGAENDVWHSSDGITWSEITTTIPWAARYSHRVVVFNNEMWVIGGFNSNGYINDVWHSADGITWTQATSSYVWGPKFEFEILVYDNKMWMIGGINGDNEVRYSTDGITWTQAIQNAPYDIRHIHRTTVYKNKMWILGGLNSSGTTSLNDVWSSSDGVTWTKATDTAQWDARYGHEVLTYSDRMWILGGFDATWLDNVWSTSTELNDLAQQIAINNNTTSNTNQQTTIDSNVSNISSNSLTITTQQTTINSNVDNISSNAGNISSNTSDISGLQTQVTNLQQQIVTLQSDSGKDSSDGVYIVFARDLLDDDKYFIDINGVNLFQDVNTTPFLFIGDNHDSLNLALTVINQLDIPNTSLQQVVAELPDNIINGTHKLNLSNVQGNSEFEVSFSDIIDFPTHDGTTWEEITPNTPIWSSRSGHASVVFKNEMWILQGGSPAGDEVWHSGDGVNWEQVINTGSNLPSGRLGHSALVFNGKMYVMGGTSSGGYANDVWSSSDGTNWTLETNNAGWPARSYFNVAVYDGKMWVYSGIGGSTLRDVWYSTDGTNWIEATSTAPWAARQGATSLAYDNKMWLISGTNATDVWHSTDGANWTLATSDMGLIDGTRYFYDAVTYDNKMWILGGAVTGAPSQDTIYNSSDGITWSLVTDAPGWAARHAHQTLVFRNKLWLLGGVVTHVGATNEIWTTTE